MGRTTVPYAAATGPSGPTDGRAGSRTGMVAAGVALVAVCYGFARFGYGLFAPEFAREFGLSGTLSGVIGSGGYVGYCVAIVASSLLTPRWGPRRVALLAGIVATVGLVVVAFASSALLLAVGLLVSGSSTGVASPPLAAAVARWVREPAQDRAQTLVNAGTGFGVLVSGPVALALLDQWRWAWAVFACIAAAVSWWIHATIPRGSDSSPGNRTDITPSPGRAVGTVTLLVASFLSGLASIAVWTFGRELVTVQGGADGLMAAAMWTLIGAAGIAGALSGPLVGRLGIETSWGILMVALGAATAGLALAPSSAWVVFSAAAVFGASYIALTGVALVWATRLYRDRTAYGVGAAFLALAAGQAVGAPLAGFGADRLGLTTVFCTCAAIALAGGLLPQVGAAPRPRPASATPST